MKRKELKQKLSRLQSRAYNLQWDIQKLIADLDIEDNAENTKSEVNSPQLNEDTLRKASVIEDGIASDSQQHEEIPAMGRTEDSLGSGKTKHNSPADTQIQNEINKDYEEQ